MSVLSFHCASPISLSSLFPPALNSDPEADHDDSHSHSSSAIHYSPPEVKFPFHSLFSHPILESGSPSFSVFPSDYLLHLRFAAFLPCSLAFAPFAYSLSRFDPAAADAEYRDQSDSFISHLSHLKCSQLIFQSPSVNFSPAIRPSAHAVFFTPGGFSKPAITATAAATHVQTTADEQHNKRANKPKYRINYSPPSSSARFSPSNPNPTSVLSSSSFSLSFPSSSIFSAPEAKQISIQLPAEQFCDPQISPKERSPALSNSESDSNYANSIDFTDSAPSNSLLSEISWLTNSVEQQISVSETQSFRPKLSSPTPSASSSPHFGAVLTRLDVSNFSSLVPSMAINFPFELDQFQKEAIVHLERNESVFVSAHTSAGKTAVALYAIALAQKHLTKAIYTSPIKSLSNQKFRDFRSTFGAADVGILTGDVSINPEANCLILTTEILRSMLYRGSDSLRDVEYLIIDEAHYLSDVERGVVWEESIILMPPSVTIVLLSATVGNPEEFANWVGQTKKRPIFVISTQHRPVPLQYYLWTKNSLFPLMEGGKFNPTAIKQANEFGLTDKKRSQQMRGIVKNRGRQINFTPLITFLQSQSLLPAIIFAFSKAQCERSANSLLSLSLNNNSEKSAVQIFLTDSLRKLLPRVEDRELPQIRQVAQLVKRGIGIHHSGLLPILKEIVEILFTKGLIKCLFATESFGMGVNAPARTSVFTAIRKHDGQQFRMLNANEFIQMAGRAGRRNMDSIGTVIIASPNEEIPDEPTLRSLLSGRSTRLESRFRLTYNMILNLLRQEEFSVREMIKRSFGEAKQFQLEPIKREAIRKAQKKLNEMEIIKCKFEQCNSNGELELFENNYRAGLLSYEKFQHYLFHSAVHGPKFLNSGRLIRVRLKRLEWRSVPAVVIKSSEFESGKPTIVCLLLVNRVSPAEIARWQLEDKKNGKLAETFPARKRNEILNSQPNNQQNKENDEIIPLLITIEPVELECIYQTTLAEFDSFLVERHRQPSLIDKSIESLNQIIPFTNEPQYSTSTASPIALFEPLLIDPLKEVRINNFSLEIGELCLQLRNSRQSLLASPVLSCPQFSSHCSSLTQQFDLLSRLNVLNSSLDVDKQNLLIIEFKNRLKVLLHLGYIQDQHANYQAAGDENEAEHKHNDQSNAAHADADAAGSGSGSHYLLSLKGRLASQINTANAIIMSELILSNTLKPLEPAELVALLSCLIFQEKSRDEEIIDFGSAPLSVAVANLKLIALKLAGLESFHGIAVDPMEFLAQTVNPRLVGVVYNWARGMEFSSICQLTTVQEGSIVRCVTRLDETCRDLRSASRILGEFELENQLQKASDLIKRDIVFAASLYVQ